MSLAQNLTLHLPILNVPLDHALANFVHNASPMKSPAEWIIEDSSHIQSIIQDLVELTKSVGIEQASFAGQVIIYPRLVVYILTHLMLYMSDESLLNQFRSTLGQWKTWDSVTVIQNHQLIRNHLLDLFRHGLQSRSETLLEKLLALDAIGLCCHLTVIITDNLQYKKILAQRGPGAQVLLDLLQARLDFAIDSMYKSRHRTALIKLSRASGLYPECLTLKELEIKGDPVAGGGFGDIYRGKLGDEEAAIKVLRVFEKSNMTKLLKEFASEAVTWRQLSHPNVLPFYGVYRLENKQRRLCLVCPWMEHGNVKQFLEQAPRSDCVTLSLDIAQGLEYLHNENIIHGDLKALNILISKSKRACLADFGLATACPSKDTIVISTGHATGTSRWMAPELLYNENSDKQHKTFASDIYAFALVCYEMFSGEIPFHDLSDFNVIGALMRGIRPAYPSDGISQTRGLNDKVWHLLETCWTTKPSERLTSGKIVEYLRALPNQSVDQRPPDVYTSTWQTLRKRADHPFYGIGSTIDSISINPSTSYPSGWNDPVLETSIESVDSLVDNSGNAYVPSIVTAVEPPPHASQTVQQPAVDHARLGIIPPPYPPKTVQQIMADRARLDITQYVHKDPKYKFAIGSGSSADVYKAIYKVSNPDTNEPFDLHVVVKVLRGTPNQKMMIDNRLNREIACWRGLKHPNIVELLGIAYILPGQPPGLVSRYVTRRDFLKYIGSHPELKPNKAKEIASGLQYLHEQGVVHGDIKANNVIMSDRQQAQLTDFELSRVVDMIGFTTTDNTQRNIRWTAPELMPLDIDINVRPTPESDIFSLGMLLLQLFHAPDSDKQRRLPYNHIRFVLHFDTALVKRIREGDRPRRERYNFMEDRHWEIISKCWAGEPENRPNIKVIHDSL